MRTLQRQIEIKVFDTTNTRIIRRYRLKAGRDREGNRLGYTSQGVDKVLEQFVDAVDAAMPGHQYRLVETGASSFNVVWGESKQTEKAEAI